jgi:cell division septum initiation protein DivIVA
VREELAQARLQGQTQQSALETAARDVQAARKAAEEARAEAKASREQATAEARVQAGRVRELEIQAAELRGAKGAVGPVVAEATPQAAGKAGKGSGARKGSGPQDLLDC